MKRAAISSVASRRGDCGRRPVHVALAVMGAVSGVVVLGLLAVDGRVQLCRVRQRPVLVRLEKGASSARQHHGPGLDVLVQVLGLVESAVPEVIRWLSTGADPYKIVAASADGATEVVAAATRSRMIYVERVIPAMVAVLLFR